MSAVWLVALKELRHRRRELVVIALLVAVAGSAIMASIVAADRAGSSIDRYLEWSRLSTTGLPLDPDEIGPMVRALQELPGARAVTASSNISLVVVTEDQRTPYQDLTLTVPDPLASDWTDDVAGVDTDRPIVLAGRMPDPGRADEVLLFEWIADQSGWEIGDQLTALTLARADEGRLDTFPGFNGPTMPLEVVGIGRGSNDISGHTGQAERAGWGSPQLIVDTRDEALWWPAGLDVRTADGAIDEFELAAVLGTEGVELESVGFFAGTFVGGVTDARAAAIETATATVRTMSVGLVMFAAAATVASALVVGQAVARHVAGAERALSTLRALGLCRRDRALAVTLPVAVATVAGTVVAAATAIVASRWLPTGLARRAEVDPGIWVRPQLLVPVACALSVAVIGTCFVVAVRGHRPLPRPTSGPTVASALSRLGAPPAVDVGTRMALVRGRPPRDLPLRSAVTGLSLAVLGTAAAMLLTTNVRDLHETPERWGWTWSSAPEYLGDDLDGTLAGLVADDRIADAGFFSQNGVTVNGVVLGGFTVEPLKGELVVPSRLGRLPEGDGEIALGSRTLRRLGVEVGETVSLGDFSGGRVRTVTVVGAAVFAYDIAETSDDGAFMLPSLLHQLSDPSAAVTDLLLGYAPGTDAAALEADLAERLDLVFHPYAAARAPADVRNLAVTGQVSTALAIFFGSIGLLAVIHAGLVAGRRRRLDVAVLRALGMVERQIRLAFLTQSVVFSVIAVAIGVPAGVLLGRIVWRSVTGELGVVTDMTVPWWHLALLAPIAVVTTAGISWWPGRTAARRDPTDALRAE